MAHSYVQFKEGLLAGLVRSAWYLDYCEVPGWNCQLSVTPEGHRFLLVQDKARSHVPSCECVGSSWATGNYATDWSSHSPDLNAIEHRWDIILRCIRRNQVPPQALIQIWKEIPRDTILRLIRSMSRCYQEWIGAHGGHTHLGDQGDYR